MSKANASKSPLKIAENAERRRHRRHDLQLQEIPVERWDGAKAGKPLGTLVDLSAGGLCIRTDQANIRPAQQIRVRLKLPVYAGISPFVAPDEAGITPRNEWVGWMTVARVAPVDGLRFEVAGQLADMDDLERGMLGLYLSTQPLAA